MTVEELVEALEATEDGDRPVKVGLGHNIFKEISGIVEVHSGAGYFIEITLKD